MILDIRTLESLIYVEFVSNLTEIKLRIIITIIIIDVLSRKENHLSSFLRMPMPITLKFPLETQGKMRNSRVRT